ncbi:MAG: DUF115 domain-containing protein [Candidatus Omnitrophota bacterium]|jgi:hypothetical protein|nr:MAG: DUF115 domain-containing protein [Candidatus Omnitrophota bacterium]
MSIYEQNLNCLQTKDPFLAEQIAGGYEDADIQVQQTQSGMPTLLVRKENQSLALHHPQDPIGHSQTFLASIRDLRCAQNIALLGCGLGYLPLLILQQRPCPRRFFILEPSLSVFRAAMQTVDLTPLLKNPAVTFLIENQRGDIYRALMPHLMEILANSLLLIDVPPSTSTFPDWAQSARKQIQELMHFGQSGLLTKFKDGPLCLTNLIKNLEAITTSPGIGTIRNVFSDIPAIIVAAGPSLEKNITQLQPIQNQFLIIATDTAYHKLLKHGIIPHFVVTVDPTQLNLSHFPSAQYGPDTILLFDPESHPDIVRKFPVRVSYMTDKHPFFEWLDRQTGGKGSIKKGGMVSQAGFYAAAYFGCYPIIFIGQDLALDPVDGATHAVDTAQRRNLQFIENDKNHIDVPLPNSLQKTNREPLYWVEGVDGKPVPTMQSFLIYLRMMEDDIRNSTIAVIDATEGGAKIPGARIQTLAETIEKEKKDSISLPVIMDTVRKRLAGQSTVSVASIRQSLLDVLNRSVAVAREGLERLSYHDNISIRQLEAQSDEYRIRIFSDPVAEYLIEYGAPKEVFEFLKLGPADAQENERGKILEKRYRKLLEAVQEAEKRLEI